MNRQQSDQSERGKPASFDPRTGEVYGSGADAGGGGSGKEDYDADPMAGSGAEPASGPRSLEQAEPGRGDRMDGEPS